MPADSAGSSKANFASADAARVGGGLYSHVLEALCTLATDPAPSVVKMAKAVLLTAGVQLTPIAKTIGDESLPACKAVAAGPGAFILLAVPHLSSDIVSSPEKPFRLLLVGPHSLACLLRGFDPCDSDDGTDKYPVESSLCSLCQQTLYNGKPSLGLTEMFAAAHPASKSAGQLAVAEASASGGGPQLSASSSTTNLALAAPPSSSKWNPRTLFRASSRQLPSRAPSGSITPSPPATPATEMTHRMPFVLRQVPCLSPQAAEMVLCWRLETLSAPRICQFLYDSSVSYVQLKFVLAGGTSS